MHPATATLSYPQVILAMSLAAKLIAKDPLVSCREIVLANFPIRLGRGPETDVRVGDRWVSREHCEIDCVDGVLLVRDLGSKHGTFVNGRSVLEAELKPGDLLNIGITRFVVEYDSAHTAGFLREPALASQ